MWPLYVVAGCRRQLLSGGAPTYTAFPSCSIPARTFAAAAAIKTRKRGKKEDKEPEVKKEPRVIDDKDRHKPFGKTAWAPVDDVYILRYYPRTVYSVADAVDLLKSYQVLDFTAHNQPVYVDLKLDMKLEKKKKVDPFVSTVHLPHPFKTEMNKVVVFTEDVNQANVAKEGGASFVGGAELIQPILDDEIVADFYVSVPEMLAKLTPLKNKLRKKFPKSNRGSVGINVPKMLELFKTGHEYAVESECYVRTQIATLDLPKEHILANLQTILMDVCSHRPANMGPFVKRAIITSHTSEALWFNSDDLLPKLAEE
ncbi:39S ribosomal protein L1, mitochondrial isoform X2 [Dunckerocampus dactyliophorus]|uniref:39S ribosomal protein L1, mitochondrial isoform X2 n=1 Tax=Dunckerocampus dactyliophorus TaxID=161453 RepID=UPI0024068C64|nr:39S ribosomal protein L1, mitochondrial isoform X2 [Dunckerocampus dactyliophorus]